MVPPSTSLLCQDAFVTLASTALDELVQFYADLLQQAPAPYWPNRYAEFRLPGLKLGIFQPAPDQQQEFQGPSRSAMSLCLEVRDLERAIATCTRLGCPPVGPIRSPSHGREVYVYDPQGNRLILHASANQTGIAR